MCISKILTLTSVVNILSDSALSDKDGWRGYISTLTKNEEILVIDSSVYKTVNEDELVEYIREKKYKVIISDSFSVNFNVYAANRGILAIEVSKTFINKIIQRSANEPVKMFIDIQGMEMMFVNTGEKEYFELNNCNLEGYKNGKDDADNLHAVWNEINYPHKKEESYACAID